MDFADQTISHLAAANHQLANVHSQTLGHLEQLYLELKKVRARNDKDENSKKNNDEDEARSSKKKCNLSEKNYRASINKAKVCTSKIKRLRKFPRVDGSECENVKIIEKNELRNFKFNGEEKSRSSLQQKISLDEQPLREDPTEIGKISRKLKVSETERAKLLAEIDTFRTERSKADGRILQLEESLERLELEKKCHEKEEAERSASLVTKLSEEVAKNKKYLESLEKAKAEIENLKEEIQAKSTDLREEKESYSSETTDNVQQSEPSSLESNANLSLVSEEFKRELTLKREARQRAIAAVSSEMDRLRRELEAEKTAHSETMKILENLKENRDKESKTYTDEYEKKTDKKTQEQVEALRLSDLLKISDEIISDLWLQLERCDDLRFQLESDPEEHRLRIRSLKRLSDETRATMQSRRQQINVLKDRLAQILVRLGDRTFLDTSDDVKMEIERQVEDISRSRNLSDERSRIFAELKDNASKELHSLKLKLENSKKDNQILEEELQKTEEKLETQNSDILNLESQLGLTKADCRDLQNQMSVINSLFTQMLLGASSAEMDLDRLTQLLQENHDLISEMARQNGTEAAALPKLLIDIIEQVNGSSDNASKNSEDKKDEEDLQEESIANNLPKVWRVLLELLSCHVAQGNSTTSASSAPDSCYKSVDTPAGPRLVISVSKTYIRLKELILEKKQLEKEMGRMKQLNTHLESKLSEQEKRLSEVSVELGKTWNIVGRMQAQHQQLHTHEKILRYELQQKRKMLQELKQELEYCREKWESARQKNTNTEIQWRNLRKEFAARKALANRSDSFSNSGESGFSDERDEESDDDEEDVDSHGNIVRLVSSRRRSRKEDSRSKTPETESELPTDTEISESKTNSSCTSGLRSPEVEVVELENQDNVDNVNDTSINSVDDNVPNIASQQVIDPLEEALTNVIENLIQNDNSNEENASLSTETPAANTVEPLTEENNADAKAVNANEEIADSSDRKESEDPKLHTETISLFSIGPVSSQSILSKNVQFSDPLVVGPSSETEQSNEEVVPSNEAKNTCVENNYLKPDVIQDFDNVSVGSASSNETVKEFSNESNETINGSSSQTDNTDPSCSVIESAQVSDKQNQANSNVEPIASSSSSLTKNSEKVLDAREARLKRLEEQANWLVKRMSATNQRGNSLNSRLEELHETYGSTTTPTPPPLPDVLPSFRIQTDDDTGNTNENQEKASAANERNE